MEEVRFSICFLFPPISRHNAKKNCKNCFGQREKKALCQKELRKTEKRNKRPSRDALMHLPVVSDVASMTECTGLMPTLAETPEEWAAYKQLFSMELPETEVWHRNDV